MNTLSDLTPDAAVLCQMGEPQSAAIPTPPGPVDLCVVLETAQAIADGDEPTAADVILAAEMNGVNMIPPQH